MLMHNPPHPGEVLRKLCLEPLGLSVTAAAKALGVSRKTLSGILNGRSGILAGSSTLNCSPMFRRSKLAAIFASSRFARRA